MGTITTNHSADKFERVWAALSSGDRVVLLGHDDDTLTVADKVRLAAISRRLSRRVGPNSTSRTPD